MTTQPSVAGSFISSQRPVIVKSPVGAPPATDSGRTAERQGVSLRPQRPQRPPLHRTATWPRSRPLVDIVSVQERPKDAKPRAGIEPTPVRQKAGSFFSSYFQRDTAVEELTAGRRLIRQSPSHTLHENLDSVERRQSPSSSAVPKDAMPAASAHFGLPAPARGRRTEKGKSTVPEGRRAGQGSWSRIFLLLLLHILLLHILHPAAAPAVVILVALASSRPAPP
jgi:hypothetical protein